MKILFLHEYCYPVTPGGAEESMMELGASLSAAGHAVRIATPHYTGARQEIIRGIEIERYPFPKKIAEGRKTVRAFWHTSILFWVISTWYVVRAVRRFRPDVIHIQGKFHVPAGVIASRLFRIPTVFTARDYRTLCNYGRCISEHHSGRRCTPREYWLWEVPAYIREYTSGAMIVRVVNYALALRGRLWSSWLYFWVRRVDQVIAVSWAVARIFEVNGITVVTPIYNIQPPFVLHAAESVRSREVLFIGKLTPGKGGKLLAPVIKKTLEQNPEIRWTLYTNGGVLLPEIRRDLQYLIDQKFVTIRPYIAHSEMLARIRQSALVFIPSVWQEPLTRLALESLLSGTPVVVTDRGGSPEIVKDGVTGRVVGADEDVLADAVLDVMKNGDAYRARIAEEQENLTNTFCVQPLAQHNALYKKLGSHPRTLGVLLPPGGSLRGLDAHGQKSRFFIYLRAYARVFDRVYIFSYEHEEARDLPDNVTLIAPKSGTGKRMYTLLMPFVQKKFFKQCAVLRVMQMDGCVPAVFACWLYGIPFVATFGYKYVDFARLNGRAVFAQIMRGIEWLGVRAAKHIIYTTRELRAYLEHTYGAEIAPRLVHIPNGVFLDQVTGGQSARDPHLLLFVGRLEKQKNLFALLEAVALLPERGELKLVWIGTGSLRGLLEQRAHELGIALTFIDRVDHAALPEWYQKAGIFTLVSHIEGMPKVLIEAMGAGAPCLVSDCDGNREIIRDGETGIIVGTDSVSISAGLSRLLRDPALCEKLGKQAHFEARERYNLDSLLKFEIALLNDAGNAILKSVSEPERAWSPSEARTSEGEMRRALASQGRATRVSEEWLPKSSNNHNKMDKNAKIYVAGHRGLVGAAITRILQEQGYTNMIGRTHEELDLRDARAVAVFLAQEKPEYVYLAAAKVGGIVANQEAKAEMFFDNMAIELNVIHEAYKNGVKKLVFLGSSCIYPKFAPQPIKEEHLMTGHLEPTNDAYAVAKIAGIQMCRAYHEQYGFKSACVMPCNLFGPGDNFDLKTSHVLPGLLRKVVEAKERGDKEIVMWGTGTPRREFLYVDDMARAAIFLMESAIENGNIYNVGMGDDIAIRDLLLLISEVVGYQGAIVQDTTKPDGTPRKLMDSSKLRALGWTHQITLREGIEKTHAWYLNNR